MNQEEGDMLNSQNKAVWQSVLKGQTGKLVIKLDGNKGNEMPESEMLKTLTEQEKKVNRFKNLLRLKDSNNDKSIYPMLDEYGYSFSDFFIFFLIEMAYQGYFLSLCLIIPTKTIFARHK